MVVIPLVILQTMVSFLSTIFSKVPKASAVGEGVYTIEENAGVSTVSFTGTSINVNGHDPNDSDIPLGGLIVSSGTVAGFGYQPLVALVEQSQFLLVQLPL